MIYHNTTYYTILYYTILYYTILYYTVLYYNILSGCQGTGGVGASGSGIGVVGASGSQRVRVFGARIEVSGYAGALGHEVPIRTDHVDMITAG